MSELGYQANRLCFDNCCYSPLRNKNMHGHVNRLLLHIAAVLFFAGQSLAQMTVTIDPDQRTGATVRHFGWDAKLSAGVASSPKAAKWLYEESPANLMRIPIRPQLSTPDGKIKLKSDDGKNSYTLLIKSIKMGKKHNPDMKVFASTKLLGAKTFPSWMHSNQVGKIFNEPAQCPNPKKYAELIKNYFELMASEGIKIDFLGLNNEVGDALTAEIYVDLAKSLQRKLKKSTIDDQYKDFQWVGCEEFGVPGSLRYARDLLKAGAADFVDVVGSHYYPDKESGSIENWGPLSSLGVPSWHTEVHVRSSEDPLQNILVLRDGMSIVFKTNRKGVQGYVWWGGSARRGFLGNLIRHDMIRSMLYGSCVATSGSYEAKGNPPNKRVTQATRVGDTVWLWCFNPGPKIKKLSVDFSKSKIETYKAKFWTGGEKVGPQSLGELKVDRINADQLALNEVPAQSISLLQVQLEDDQMLLPMQKWQLRKPSRKTIEASLSKATNETLFFKTRRKRKIKVDFNDLDPQHRNEVLDAIKAHGQ